MNLGLAIGAWRVLLTGKGVAAGKVLETTAGVDTQIALDSLLFTEIALDSLLFTEIALDSLAFIRKLVASTAEFDLSSTAAAASIAGRNALLFSRACLFASAVSVALSAACLLATPDNGSAGSQPGLAMNHGTPAAVCLCVVIEPSDSCC